MHSGRSVDADQLYLSLGSKLFLICGHIIITRDIWTDKPDQIWELDEPAHDRAVL